MKKILFLIHDLGQGGAEKVLVNLVNNMDPEQFDITVMTLFDVGVNRQFLAPHVRYRSCFRHMLRGNSRLMQLLSPRQLHRWLIREHYDVEVAYLEGPSARVISGCEASDTKLLSWIHIELHSAKAASVGFRSIAEAKMCYSRFERILCVSEAVKDCFQQALCLSVPHEVCYNTNESEKILRLAQEAVEPGVFREDEFRIVGVGKLLKSKGFDRLLRIAKRLRDEGYPIHVYLLGNGPEQRALEAYAAENGIGEQVTLLGYQTNPYKYVAGCDLFVCASFAEGFSTAATEALILSTPVCTVEVSGMKEMLGGHDEYGLVTENSEEALHAGIRRLLDEPELLAHYRERAAERGRSFRTEVTVRAVEELLERL